MAPKGLISIQEVKEHANTNILGLLGEGTAQSRDSVAQYTEEIKRLCQSLAG